MSENQHLLPQMPMGKSVYVYQLPIRIWHWVMVACIVVLIVTGYIIGKPWLSVVGEPYETFYMGYTRMAHFTAGFVLIISTVLRYIYGIIWGNRYSRELIILPVWSKAWWNDLWQDIRWYLFLNKECGAHVGHNPLAQMGMAVGMVFMLVIMLTGLGMYAQDSHVPFLRFFAFVQDWINDWLGGNGQMTRSLHRLGMLLLVTFVTVHLYMVVREEIMGKTTLVSSMFSGFRQRRRK